MNIVLSCGLMTYLLSILTWDIRKDFSIAKDQRVENWDFKVKEKGGRIIKKNYKGEGTEVKG